MKKYQDANYRTIHVSEPLDVAPLGKCWLVLFVEDLQEYDGSVPDNLRWWTALFLVCPQWAGGIKVRSALDFIDFPGKPAPVDEAVALAEAGNRLVLWVKQSEDWEPDEATALAEADRYVKDTSLLTRALEGRTLNDLR